MSSQTPGNPLYLGATHTEPGRTGFCMDAFHSSLLIARYVTESWMRSNHPEAPPASITLRLGAPLSLQATSSRPCVGPPLSDHWTS